MILAAILRNFKCYKGIHVVPFCDDDVFDMNIIIGDNGVGKSAILEGLDTFFNDAPWIVNNDIKGKKTDVSVGAVMLVLKNFVDSILDSREQQIMSEISDLFWTVDETNPVLRQYAVFFDIRKKVLSYRDNYYLFIAGREYEQKDILFLSFTKLVNSSITLDPKPSVHTLSKIVDKILSLYSYIYIPVETSISDFVKLQNQSMQTLTDSNVKTSITNRLKEKFINRTRANGTKEKRSLLDYVNDALEGYVKNVEKDIQQINAGYSYKPGPRQMSKLTANHITDAIVSAYYSRRSLKKDGKDIQNLSSGEKRIILIDIISAFIKKDNPDRELIIGIDEPENSLHISKCYDQFKKIEDIALNYSHQLFVTTHWYGSLPCLTEGCLIHIGKENTLQTVSISNYYEKRGALPNDIQLKGYFDLTSSLLYAYRNSGKHWLLVEGNEDKKYINYYLQDKNVNIIPLGGCGNVKKVYEYLFIPMSADGFNKFSHKIFCLIDTDKRGISMNVTSGDDKSPLLIRRLQEQPDGDITLLRVENPDRNPTEIEEVLEPKQFYESLSDAIDKYGDKEDKEAFSAFDFDDTSVNSRIKDDDSILKQNTTSRNAKDDKRRIKSFVDGHKDEIASIYVAKPYTGVELPWIHKLKDLLATP